MLNIFNKSNSGCLDFFNDKQVTCLNYALELAKQFVFFTDWNWFFWMESADIAFWSDKKF